MVDMYFQGFFLLFFLMKTSIISQPKLKLLTDSKDNFGEAAKRLRSVKKSREAAFHERSFFCAG